MQASCNRFGFFVLICLIIGLIGGVGYYLYYMGQKQKELQESVAATARNYEQMAKRLPLSRPAESVTTSVKTEIWRPIQEKIKDAVVQIFAQRSEYDFLQPFKTPEQYAVCGSGFFIDKEGKLVTNAHVVTQARAIWIQIPSLGKRIIEVELVGLSPDRDVALCQLTPEALEIVRSVLGEVPVLPLGDSDTIRRADEVMALGYPLSQQSLKATTGVISGREQHMIQMSAAINPGSSGGPLLNVDGEVVGINTSGFTEAQNVAYITPINTFKVVYDDLCKVKLLRKPYLGIWYTKATDHLTEFLGNPQPGGCYVVEVVKDSTLFKAGIQKEDMIYEVNGHRLDIYGEMNVAWSEDKISIIDYVSSLSIGQDVQLVAYRKGKRIDISLKFNQTELPSIRKVYPDLEPIDYEIVGGMVVMPLTINHIQLLGGAVPGLSKYSEAQYQSEPRLIITHIFPTSELYKARTVSVGSTINEINGMKVATLDELRAVLKKTIDNKFLTVKASDNVLRLSDSIFVVLPSDKVLAQEERLAREYRYTVSPLVKNLLEIRKIGVPDSGVVIAQATNNQSGTPAA